MAPRNTRLAAGRLASITYVECLLASDLNENPVVPPRQAAGHTKRGVLHAIETRSLLCPGYTAIPRRNCLQRDSNCEYTGSSK